MEDAIEIAAADWDNFETSWDFRDLPLLRPGLKGATLEAILAATGRRIARAQHPPGCRSWRRRTTGSSSPPTASTANCSPKCPRSKSPSPDADARKDIAAFLSYAVGCMMGRYSLDAPGLILADAGDTLANYLTRLGKPIEQLSFVPDADGILPILDGDWFEDDIVARARQFLRATFGDATLEANLRFIEASLGKDLRKYFLTDFYKDHLQTYKKRPIYWLFQSPKKGFNALIYLHRYTRDTVNRVLNRYLREYLHKLQARLDQLDHIQASAGASARDKTQARKESDQLRRIRRDCEEYERDILLPLAQQRLELDLDDGVKVNYLKLGDALAPIPGLAASSE
ncbi:MAG: BREX-1 system adenine-specific DNA-methyltransferase PglX [Chromatiales bacterium]|nr:BREX-1 system adenine-specific DNA-methyltransferase PglX [Chromatiales bacterium]